MIRPRAFVVTFVLLGVLASAAAASAARAPTFVSTDWLARHLHDPGLVVLHAAQQRSDYDAGHVPGARFVPWSAFAVARDSLSVELPEPAAFDSLLEAAGVSDDSRIVITGGPVTTLSRLFVTLDWFGAGDRTSLLAGGGDAWREEGRPLARDSAVVAPGHVTPRIAAARVVDAAWIEAHAAVPADRVTIVDARAPEYYEGLSSNRDPRNGRLPGAGNVPFHWLTAELGRFRAPRDLARLFAHAGVERGDHVVTYCHIGVQASVAYVAARSLGYEVSIYDGSFQDWSRRTELPVETGPAVGTH